MTVKFEISNEDAKHVKTILRRAKKYFSKDRLLDVEMSLVAAHANGCPMDFARLATADDFNLAHDTLGIARNIDTRTGKLTNCFWPRFARKDAEDAA